MHNFLQKRLAFSRRMCDAAVYLHRFSALNRAWPASPQDGRKPQDDLPPLVTKDFAEAAFETRSRSFTGPLVRSRLVRT